LHLLAQEPPPDLWRDKHDMTVAKLPPDNRSIMEQWHELLRDMEAAGAIEITPDDPAYKVLGIANRSNGDGTQHLPAVPGSARRVVRR
jgi:hypothetical protein